VGGLNINWFEYPAPPGGVRFYSDGEPVTRIPQVEGRLNDGDAAQTPDGDTS